MSLTATKSLESTLVELDAAKIRLPRRVRLVLGGFSENESDGGTYRVNLCSQTIYRSKSKREARDYYQRASKAIEEGMYEIEIDEYGSMKLNLKD